MALLFNGSATLAAEATVPPAYRLHISWSSDRATVWSGRAKISNGRFSSPQSLSFEADEPGSVWIDRGDLRFKHRTPRKLTELRVNATADDRASLHLEFRADDGRAQPFEVNLADVLNRAGGISIQHGALQLAIQCPSARSLTVEIPREHMIYESSERFQALLRLGSMSELSQASTANLSWRITPARDSNTLASGTQFVNLDAVEGTTGGIPVEFDVPSVDGVYDVHFQLTATTGGLVESRTQFVVVDSRGENDVGSRSNNEPLLVDDFDPATTRFFRKIAIQGDADRVKRSFGKTLQISPHAVETSGDRVKNLQPWQRSAWIAYRLKIQEPRKAHRLVVQLPEDVGQQLGIAILQPNAAGQLMPTGIHTGVHLESATVATPRTGSGHAIRHDLSFWPQDRETVLLLHSLDVGRPIEFGKIEVYEDATPLPRSSESDRTHLRRHRWVAPLLHKPLLAELFGASETYDPQGRRSLEDWVTFHQAAGRLSGYLRSQGYPAVMLAVTADGSALYPSRLLAPTPRYDTGTLQTSGQDPLRKDVVELLLRTFDRDGLLLVPQLQFSTPLPRLESQLADGGTSSTGIELIGRSGRSWREQHGSSSGHAPYYNPLDPRVQQAVLAVVKEFVDRYQAHNALAGVALELNNRGFLHLPSLEWGYDDETISRFRAATGVVIPNDRGKNRFANRFEYLTTQAAAAWTDWRCEQLSAFHLQLVGLITERLPDARVFFDCTNLLEADSVDASRGTIRRMDQLMRGKGLHFERYQGIPQLTILRPVRLNFPGTINAGGGLDLANHDPTVDALFQCSTRGTLIYQAPHEKAMPGIGEHLDVRVPFDWILSQTTLPGREMRRYLAHSLAAHDPLTIFYGGWMIPMGQEAASRDIRDVISALPAVRFHDINRQSQPVVVRVAREGEQTHLYAVNDSAGEVKVELSLSCPPSTVCRRLGAKGIQLQSGRSGQGSLVSFQLPPYGVWAATFAEANLRVTETDVQLSPAMIRRLATTIDDFQKRMGRSSRSERSRPPQVVQASFEAEADGSRSLPGWDLSNERATSWTLDDQNPRSGQTALRLATDESQPATLLSPTLPTHGHRYLTTALWMRSDRDNADVKLTLQGELDGRPYSRTAQIQVGQTWQEYFFRVPNLPPRGLSNLRLRVDAVAGGRLWIDDVEIKTHHLTPENSWQLSKTLAAAKLALSDRRYADCQRLLDSYWGRYLLDEQQVSLSKKDEPVKFSDRLRNIFRR